MRKTTYELHTPALRFKHFTNKGYALFACMGRVVVVGTLSAATLQHAKAEGLSIRPEVASDTLQRTELKLDEVIVTGSRAPLTQSETAKIVTVITRDDVQRAAVTSINDVLKLATGVDVRQRGGFGVQTDISVRGGNFDQITILLNGIPISSPHTGHLSADFPLSPDDIERIEVLEGPSARVYGAQAFNGVINVVTRTTSTVSESKSFGGYANLAGGSYGYFNGNASLASSHAIGTSGTLRHSLSGGVTRSDGATPNSDFRATRFFYQGSYKAKDWNISTQAGYSYKPYAANTFYGTASTDQWESNERWMAAIKADTHIGAVHLSPQIYWNRWYDHYQWHKDVSPGGENFHKVDVYGGGINSWVSTALGKTSLGVEIRNEGIWSTNLGEKLPAYDYRTTQGIDGSHDRQYTNHDRRTNVSAFLEHNILLRQWTLSLGILANYNTALDTRWRFYPGIDIAYRPSEHCTLYASYNMALRMPTFTDLYYSGKGIEGNSHLRPEKTSDIQLGTRYNARGLRSDIQLFYSHKTDMIDWVTYRAALSGYTDNIYHSVNFRLNTIGMETNITLLPRELFSPRCPLRSVSLRYAYTTETSHYDVNVIQSKYAMDYLRHKVIVSADGTIWRNLMLSLSWRWQQRVGDGNDPYALLDGKLSWQLSHWSVYVDATNLFNKQYYDYISIPQPKRCIMAGLKLMF